MRGNLANQLFAHRLGTMCRRSSHNDLLNQHTSDHLTEQHLGSTSRKGDSQEEMLCNILLPHPSRNLGIVVAGWVAAAEAAKAAGAEAAVAEAAVAEAAVAGVALAGLLRSPHMCCRSHQP